MSKRKAKNLAQPVQNSNEPGISIKINRGILYATWAGAIVSLIAVISGIAFFLINQSAGKESLVFTSVQRITIAHTELQPTVDPFNTGSPVNTTGILSAYWRVFLSNNSDKDLSIVKYRVLQISNKDYPAISYTGMDQGLYVVDGNDVKPLSLPLSIPSGSTVPVIIKIGVTMKTEEYHFVIDKFGEKPQYEIQDIESFLRSEHETDIYGNVIKQTAAGVWSYPSLDRIREQIFRLSFETARGSIATGLVSWYVYSGFFNQFTNPKSP